MKLSQAIALGRTMLAPCVYGGDAETKGCALGMAVVAVKGYKTNWKEARKIWPWLDKMLDNGQSFGSRIFTLWDYEVMDGKMTLDQLIDYVASIEPTEETAQEESNVLVEATV